MKKSRVILAIVLAAVLLITVISAPTFSWFTRPSAALEGNKMKLTSQNTYRAYNGNDVTMTTDKSTDEWETSTPCDNSSLASSVSVGSGDRDYYCTTITNNSGVEQNVSLYASSLTSNTLRFALGVNGPTRTYRDYTLLSPITTTPANSTTMRVFFQRPSDEYVDGTNWHTGRYFVKYWNDSGTIGYKSLIDTGDHSNYYVDISKYATKMYFYVENASGADCTGSLRTPDISIPSSQNQTTTQKFIAWNEVDGNHNVKYNYNEVQGANVISYYGTITLPLGSAFDAGLHYPNSKGTMEYYTDPSGVCSVDAQGVITAKSVGTATLYSKAVGETFSDTYEVQTTITVVDSAQTDADVPIVKNILIPASGGTEDNPANVVKVYWYIKNTGTSSLTYSIDNIYLGM